MTRLRIALVSQSYDSGGVATVVRWLRTSLLSRGHQVDVHVLAASARDPISRRVIRPSTWRRTLVGARIGGQSDVYRWGADWVELEGQRYRPRPPLTKCLNDYDLIQVVAGGPALALAASRARPPVLLQCATSLAFERPARLHGMGLIRGLVKRLTLDSILRLERAALESTDHVFVENRQMEQWVGERIGSTRVTFAPPGIDTRFFSNSRPWDREGPVIAFGRLDDPRKDWGTALRAFEILASRYRPSARLLLCGQGPVPARLENAVKRSSFRDSIALATDIPMEQLPQVLSSGSLFLQSSLEEGLGLAGIEAMACGLPVIATKTAGSLEYVRDGLNGHLVDLGPHAAEHLAEAMASTLAGQRGMWQSSNARAIAVTQFGADAAFARYEQVYTRVATARQDLQPTDEG